MMAKDQSQVNSSSTRRNDSSEHLRLYLLAVEGLLVGGDRGKCSSEYLERFSNVEFWLVCKRVIDLHPNELIRFMTMELKMEQKKAEYVWGASVLFACQRLRHMIKSKQFWKLSDEEMMDLKQHLLAKWLHQYTQPPLSEVPGSTKIVTQLGLCLAGIAIKCGAKPDIWSPMTVLQDLFTEFNGARFVIDVTILLEILQYIAEEIEDDGFSMRLDARKQVKQALLDQAHHVLDYLTQFMNFLLVEMEQGSELHLKCVTKVMQSFCAWVHLRAFSFQTLGNSGFMDMVQTMMKQLALLIMKDLRGFIQGNNLGDSVTFFSESFQVIRSVSKMCRDAQVFPDGTALINRFEEVSCKNLFTQNVLERGLDPLFQIFDTFAPILDTDDDFLVDDVSKFLCNLLNAMASLSAAIFSCQRDTMLAYDREMSPEFYHVPNELLEKVLFCTRNQSSSMEVSKAFFDFFLNCQAHVLELGAVLSPGNNRHLPLIQAAQPIAMCYETAVQLYSSSLARIPVKKIFHNQWDTSDQDDFREYRRDIRDLLRKFVGDKVPFDLTMNVNNVGNGISEKCNNNDGKGLAFRYLAWVERSVRQWKENREGKIFELEEQLDVEAILHGLSAVTRYLPGSTESLMDSIVMHLFGVVSQASTMNAPTIHRTLLQAIAVLAGVLGSPSRGSFQLVKPVDLFHFLAMTLYIPETDTCFPFRTAEDHVGAVGIMKICKNEVVASQLAHLELEEPGKNGNEPMFSQVVILFHDLCSKVLVHGVPEPLENPHQVDLSRLAMNQAWMAPTSLDLLFQGLCDVLFSILDQNVFQQTSHQIFGVFMNWVVDGHKSLAKTGDLVTLKHVCTGFHFFGQALEALKKKKTGQEFSQNLVLMREFMRPIVPAASSILETTQIPFGCHPFNKGEDAGETLIGEACTFLSAYLPTCSNNEDLSPLIRICGSRVSFLQNSVEKLEQPVTSSVLKMLSSVAKESGNEMVLGQCIQLAMSVLEQLNRFYENGLLYYDVAPTTTMIFVYFCRIILEKMASSNGRESHKALYGDFMCCCITVFPRTHSQQTPKNIENQHLVLQMLKLHWALLFGHLKVDIDVFQTLTNVSPIWLDQRNTVLLQRGCGVRMTQALFDAAAGRLPSWSIDKLALIIRGMRGQFRDSFIAWVMNDLRNIFKVESVEARFIQQLQDEALVMNIPKFKTALKTVCGGKRKGDNVNKPRLKEAL